MTRYNIQGSHTYGDIFKAAALWMTIFLCSSWIVLPVNSAMAKPRKLSNVEWQTDWIHPGSSTARSQDRRGLTTQLPRKTRIKDDYHSPFKVQLSGGKNTVVTITPMSHQQAIVCPSLTVSTHVVTGYCRAKRNGLKNIRKKTKITVKVKTPGSPARYLSWTLKPWGPTNPPPSSRATQIYVIGPAQMPAFIREARERHYRFRVIPQRNFSNPPGNHYGVLYQQIGGESFEKGQIIKFGDLIPQPLPQIKRTRPNDGMLVSMFERTVGEGAFLKEGWTFLSAHYVGHPGETCQREIRYEYPGTNRIWHQFSVRPFLHLQPGHATCSKLWLQSIKLKGPKGKKPTDALLEE